MKKLIFTALLSLSLVSQEQNIFYKDADIKTFAQDIALLTDKTIILDPRVKGKITIYSNANLNRDQVWDVYLRTIQVNGFSAINDDNFVRIVPENEATRDSNSADSDGEFVTRIIGLNNDLQLSYCQCSNLLLEDKQTFQALRL